MYTSKIIIEHGNGFKVTSYGNGAAYEIENETSGASVFLQGDDASAWRAAYDAMQCKPDIVCKVPYGRALAALCDCYF